MGLVLGLDGGGSKTLLAIAAETGDVLRLERTGGVDPAGGPVWAERLEALMAAAGAFDAPLDAAVFGLPSHGEIDAQDAEQRRVVAGLAGPHALVDNDVRIAFDGAFAGAGGILLLAGTGSMAWAGEGGRSGRHVRVGGWGEAFGDEGSAFWIGREALGLATRALDGRAPARAFADALLRELGIAEAGIFAFASSLEDRRAGVAGLSRIVSRLAEAGDGDALALIEAAASHLAAHAGAARARLGAGPALPWSHAGGVFASPLFRRAVARRVGAPPAAPRLPPVGGAVLRAAGRAGWPCGEAFVARLAASLGAEPGLAPLPALLET